MADLLRIHVTLFLISSILIGCFSQMETADKTKEELQDLCKRYKFLWSDTDPASFYYCFTEKAAVQLKCRTNYYMCKRQGEAFHPCDCRYDKDLTEDETTTQASATPPTWTTETTPSVLARGFPSGGCPDPFKVFNDYHRFGGEQSLTATTLAQCHRECLENSDCIAVDWSLQQRACYIINKNAPHAPLNHKVGVNHFMRTNCDNIAFARTTPNSDIPPYEPLPTGSTPEDDYDFANGFDYEEYDYSDSEKQLNTAAPSTSTGTGTSTGTSTTFSIPDSGCPNSFQKFTQMGHPFGIDITNNLTSQTELMCKLWCLNRPYCYGVDFNSTSKRCYFFCEVVPSLLVPSSDVNHFTRTQCGKPLHCFVMSGAGDANTSVAVTDTSTTQVQCNGYCFTSLTMTATSSVLERGCSNTIPTTGLGCTMSDTMMVMTCYCKTDRCNALSIAAQAAMILYLPLDKNLYDDSGFNRFGVISTGTSAPSFSCLDRAVNCSALVTGNTCIEVRQMSQNVFGSIDTAGNVSPTLSVCVWFKRLAGTQSEGGIIGNSNSATISPSFEIVGGADVNTVSAGVDSETAPTGLNDFINRPASSNDWHLACLTYDGRTNTVAGTPLTLFYIDGTSQTGNQQADSGEVVIRDQPVTIGCVMDKHFVGFIDEARIFTRALDQSDINALMIMKDTNYI